MSEQVPGSISLEDDTPLATIAETPPLTTDPPPAPAQTTTAEDGDPEGTIEGSGGVKFVPLGAVTETRGKLRETKAALEAKEAELAQYREKAQKFDQVAQEWQAVQPLIQQVKNGTYQAPPQAPKPLGPLSEQEAVDYAKYLDLYKTDGTPDIDRAQRVAKLTEGVAARQVQQYVAPLQQQSAQQQSAQNFHAAAAWKDNAGAVVDKTILQDIWSKMPAELTAKPDVAAIMWRVALAETMLQGKHKTPTAPPPPAQHTESVGGAPQARELSSFERNFISTVDMKPKEYEEISSRFKPGERNSLE